MIRLEHLRMKIILLYSVSVLLYTLYVGVDYLILILIHDCRTRSCCSRSKTTRTHWRVHHNHHDPNGCDVNGFSRGHGRVVHIGLRCLPVISKGY